MRCHFTLALLFATLTCVASLPARGDDPVRAGDKTILREQTIYVPFEKLDAVFEKEGRGIFLPYEEFLKLWQAAQPSPQPPKIDEPPAAAVLRGGRYEGRVEDDVARMRVTFGLEALKQGWSEVRLPLENVAVENVVLERLDSAESGDAEALFSTEGKGYVVFLPAPGKYEARLEFSVRVTQEPGKKTVRFGIPQAAVSRLDLTIPEQDVRVDVQPSLAVERTTTAPDATEATQVQAFLGNASAVAISWMPALGKAGEGSAIVSATQSLRAFLGERRLTVETNVAYEVLRGEVDTFRIRAPESTRLISVEGENIREWNQEDVDGGQIVSVRLHAAARKTYALSLSFERILDETPTTLDVPFPTPEGVFRESGHAVLGYDSGLKVRVADSQGLSQLDPEDVPDDLRAHLGVGFRYLAQPLRLSLEVEKILPSVRSQTTSVVTLGREEDLWSGWIDYEIAKAGIFRLEFRVPTGWIVASVGDPSTVEEFQTEDADDLRTISVSLKSKALGTFRLPFRLSRSGSASPGELTLSPPRVLGSTQDRGLFGISAPRAIEVRTLQRQNMLDAHQNELFRSGIMGQLSSETAIPRTYRYREQPASVRLQLEQKKTEIDVLAQHLVEVADGEIRLTHLLDYEILYAEVDRLRFRAPSRLDDTLKIETKHKTEVRKVSTEEGITIWEVTLTPAVKGVVPLTLTHAEDLEALPSGEPFAFEVPLVRADEARTENGFVAIRKEGTLEIVSETVEMRTIDTSDLPAKLRRGKIYSAFRYFATGPSLTLQLTRHEYQLLADAAVQHIFMETVLTQERRLKTRATLFVQNTGRQYLELKVRPESIVTLSVNGRTQSPKKAKDGQATLVEIPPSSGAGGTFPVILFFEEPLADSAMGAFGSAQLQTLQVLNSVPVSQVALDLYLPPEYTYMGWGGNLRPVTRGETPVWTRFKRLLGTTHSQARHVGHGAQTYEQRARALARSGGVQVELPVEGFVPHRFETLAPVGTLNFRYAGRRLFSFVDFLAFVTAAAVGYYCLARKPWPKLQVGLLLVCVPLVLSWFARGPTVEVFSSLCAGSVLVCLVFVVTFARQKWEEQRATRLALAPDPFLEDAPEGPSPRSGDDEDPQRPVENEGEK